jgi:DNA-binding response OmpR family regulator
MPNKVLAIDDDNFVHRIISDALDGFTEVLHASNGEQGLEFAKTQSPDIILLDVEMPGIDGFEVCKRLKQDKATSKIPVMFLSGRTSIEERVKGYNSGAEDYLTKPFNGDELRAKLSVLYQFKSQSERLQTQVHEAHSAAEIALSDVSDLGRVMRFVSQTYSVKTRQNLARYICDFFDPINLKVVVAFWQNENNLFFSNYGATCPLEKELLEGVKDKDRFIDFGVRTIVNYPSISLLVKNMPVENPNLYGRYKDLFPYLLEATNAKLHAIDLQDQLSKQACELSDTFIMVDSSLREQVEQLTQHGKDSIELIESLYSRLSDTIPELALDPSQEDFIMSSVEATVTEIKMHLTSGNDLNQALHEVITFLRHLIDERRSLIEQLNDDSNNENENENITTQDDIELF